MSSSPAIRVLICDDQELVRAGFRLILDLEDDIEVVAEAADGGECLRQVASHAPHVVLMDIRMPVMDGVEATRKLVAAGSASHVLMLTTFDLDELVYFAMAAGASGFLLKDVPRDQLVGAIRMAARGDAVLSPTLTRRLVERFVAAPPPRTGIPTALAALTGRELEVFALVAAGKSNAEIAATLFLGEATVKTHVARILTKLDLHDRVQVVVLAYETGYLQPGRSRE
ncbi:response regulator transcription factor [Microlunatus sp. Gsoil 973]|jgi:DNA-binding NarL/FixJ family response regulator|uniref:response regulator n=1 Tax=Microlunatus sp. Gsoil 973 TaxID=2672569 RepID=UPI0012B4AB52|nr:response regulator transcription factor [Microlunatus sp. Gsoil 973]QGN32554.1 response regulator [Microlunatus sp. Gsoil 973]